MNKSGVVSRRSFVAGSAAFAAASTVTAVSQGFLASSALAEENNSSFEASITWNGIYDVIVVGFGGAGAVTAITAADNGAKVLLLDKAPEGHEGGNSRYCMQVILWIHPEMTDDAITYMQALRGSRLTPSDTMIEAYVRKVSENKDWLESMGADPILYADMAGIAEYEGEFPEYPGCTAMEPLVLDGETFTSKFWRFVKNLVSERTENIDVWYESPAAHIIRDPFTGVVLGVTAIVDGQKVNIRARNGVVLTCGGFENNLQMIQDYTELTECYAGGTQYNTGDGIKMVTEIGASLWHMENIMGPYLGTYYPDASRPEFYSGTMLSPSYYKGAFIMVGADGTRFQNEMVSLRHGYRDIHGVWMHSIAPQPCYMIFDASCLAQSPALSQTMARDLTRQINMGVAKTSDTIAGLAEQIGLNPQALEATISRYNSFCEQGIDYEFGRGNTGSYDITNGMTSAGSLVAFSEEGPYYALELKPWIINTQGGAERNEDGQIIDTAGNPIPHLYSAGEFGEMYSGPYQGSGNIGGCIAFGRISGTNASMLKDDNQPASGLVIDPIVPAPKEAPVYKLAENEYIGSAQGICGLVTVKVALADDGTIASVTILDSMETDTFGGNAQLAMPSRFVGRTAEEVYDVDGVSKATFTSVAIRNAVASALEQAK